MTKMAKDHLWPIFFGSILGGLKLSIFFWIFATLFFAGCLMTASKKYKYEKNKTVLLQMIGSGIAVLGGVICIIGRSLH